LYFKPLQDLNSLRKPSDLTPEAYNLANDIPSAIEALGGSDYAKVAVGLLLLGGGGTDECHDLVTPLSWPEETHFGYEPPVSNSVASWEASYAHSLVHRREGPNVGEFGMIGWSNANYWSNASSSRNKGNDKTLDEIRDRVLKLASGNKAAENWCKEHGIDQRWEPKALHQLCAQASYGKGNNSLGQFASDACVSELRVLIVHCLSKAGFSVE